jgi:hypothetical protein
VSVYPRMRERDDVDGVVDEVVEVLDEIEPKMLEAIGAALVLADEPPLRDLGETFRFYAWADQDGDLVRIRLHAWLEAHAGDEALIVRLAAAEQEPWLSLRAALEA